MSTKKKRRVKKKKFNEKKEFVLDFNVKKKDCDRYAILNKEFIFDVKTNEEIETELRKYSIDLNEKDILDRYQKEYDFQKLCDYYHHIFKEQISALSNMNILLDEDCILFYVDKVIKSHYQINQISDSGYISEAFSVFFELSDEEKPEYILNILNSILHLKDYRDTNDLMELFSHDFFDISGCLYEAIGLEIHNCCIDLQTAQAICHALFNILDNYTIEQHDLLYSAGLELLAQNGYNAVEEAFLNGLKKCPNSHIKLYNSIVQELLFYSKQHNDFTDVQRLYQEAMLLPVKNQDEKEYLGYITQYEDEILMK